MRNLIPWSHEHVPAARLQKEPDPFLALHHQINRLFDDYFGDFDTALARNGFSTEWPSVDVSEGDKEVKVVAELPGLDEKDIEISLRDDVLTIKGEKKHETDGTVYRERWHGAFSRSIALGSEVDPDKVKASFDKGVLSITLEKRPEAQSQVKRIAINHANKASEARS